MKCPQDEERLARRIGAADEERLARRAGMRRTANEAYGPDFYERWPLIWRAMWEEQATCPLSERGGVECGPGWRRVLEEVSERLEFLILQLPPNERQHHYVMQCKEKFFGLRLYMRCATDEMAQVIAQAEARCARLCDVCGEERPQGARCDHPA